MDEKIENYGLKASFDFEVNQKSFASMDAVQTQLAGIEDAINDTSASVRRSGLGGDIGKIASQISRQMRPLKTEFRALKAEMRNLDFGDLADEKQFKSSSQAVNQYINSLKHLQSQIHGNTAEEREFIATLKQQQRIAKNRLDMNSIQREATIKATEVGEYKFVQQAGGVLFNQKTLGTAKDMVSTYSGFDDVMSAVSASIEDHGEQYEKLRKKAMDMGATTRFTAQQAAEAEKNLAMAGLNANQILAALPSTLNLASAGQLDLAQATDIAAKTMSGMGMEAKQLNHITDILAKTATATNSDVQGLGVAMSYAAPGAKLFGASIEELAGAMGIMSNAGVAADKAGTASRSMFNRLANPPAKAKKALQQWGISVTDSAGNMRNFVDILDDVAVKLNLNQGQLKSLAQAGEEDLAKMVSQSEQLSALQDISGTTGLSGFAALLNDRGGLKKVILQNYGASTNKDLLKQVLSAQGLQIGEKDDVYDVLLSRTEGNYQQARNILNQSSGIAMSVNLKGLDSKEYSSLQASLASQGISVGKGESLFAAVNRQFPDTQKAISIVNTAMEELGFRFKTEGSSARIMAQTMEDNLAGSFRAFGSALESVKINYIDPLIPVIRFFIDTTTKFLLTLSSLPAPIRTITTVTGGLVLGLGALAIAIGAVGATLTAFRQALLVTELAEKSMATGLIPLTGFFATSMQAYEGTEPISNLVKTLQIGFTKLQEPINSTKVAMLGLGRASLAFAMSPAGLAIIALTGLYVLLEQATPQISLLGSAIAALGAPIAFFIGLVKGGFAEAWKFITEILGISGDIASSPFMQIGKSIQFALSVLSNFMDKGEAVGKLLVQILVSPVRLMVLAMKKAWQSAVGLVSVPIKVITSLVGNAVGKIAAAWQGFIDGFGGNLGTIIKPALEVAQGLINALNHNPTIVIPESWRGAVEQMQGYLLKFWHFTVGIGKNISRTVTGIFNEIAYEMIPDLIVGIDNNLVSLTNSITSIGTIITDSLTSSFNTFVYQTIPQFIVDIGVKLLSLRDSIGGLWNGITEKNKKAENKFPPSGGGLAMMPVRVLAGSIGNTEQLNQQMSNTISVMDQLGKTAMQLGGMLLKFIFAPLDFLFGLFGATIEFLSTTVTNAIGLGMDLVTNVNAIFNEDAETRAKSYASLITKITQGVVGAIVAGIAAAQKIWQGIVWYMELVNSMITPAIENMDTLGLAILSLSVLPANLIKNLYPVEVIRAASATLGPELTELGIMLQGKFISGLSLVAPGLVAIAIAKGWNKGIEQWVTTAIIDLPSQVGMLTDKLYNYLSTIPDELLVPLESVGVSPEQFRDTLSQINSYVQDFVYGPLQDFSFYLIGLGYSASQVGEQIINMLKPIMEFKISFFRPIESLLVIGPAVKGVLKILQSDVAGAVVGFLGTIATAITAVWLTVTTTFLSILSFAISLPGMILSYARSQTEVAAAQAKVVIDDVAAKAGVAAQKTFDLGKAIGSALYSVARNVKNQLVEMVLKIPVVGTYLAAGIEKFVVLAKQAVFHTGNLFKIISPRAAELFSFVSSSTSETVGFIGRVFTEFGSGLIFALKNAGKFGKAATGILFNFWKLYKQTGGFKDLTAGITPIDLIYDKLFPDAKVVKTKINQILEIRVSMVAAFAKAMGKEVSKAEGEGLRAFQKSLLYISPIAEMFSSVIIGLFTLRSLVEPLTSDFLKAATHVKMFGIEINAAGAVLGALVGSMIMLTGVGSLILPGWGPVIAAAAAAVTYFGSNAYVLIALRAGIILLTDTMLTFTKLATKGFQFLSVVTAHAGDILGGVIKIGLKTILGIAYAFKLIMASPLPYFLLGLAFGFNSLIAIGVGGVGILISGFIGFAGAVDIALIALKKLTQGYRWLVKTIGDYIVVQFNKYGQAIAKDGIWGVVKQLFWDTFNVVKFISWDSFLVRIGRFLMGVGKAIKNTWQQVSGFFVSVGQSIGYALSHPIETAQKAFISVAGFVIKNWKIITGIVAGVGAVIALIADAIAKPGTAIKSFSSSVTGAANALNVFMDTFLGFLTILGVQLGIFAVLVGYQQYVKYNLLGIDWVISELNKKISSMTNLLGNFIGLITKPIAPGIADALGNFIDGFVTYLPHIVVGVGILAFILKKTMGGAFDNLVKGIVTLVGWFGKLIGMGWEFGKTIKNAATGMEAQTKYMELAYNVRSRAKGKGGLGYESDQVEGLRKEQIEKAKALVKFQKLAQKSVAIQRKIQEKQLLEDFNNYKNDGNEAIANKYRNYFTEVEKKGWFGTKKQAQITDSGKFAVASKIRSQISNTPSKNNPSKNNPFNDDFLKDLMNQSGIIDIYAKYKSQLGLEEARKLAFKPQIENQKFVDEFNNAVLGEQTVEMMYVGSLNLSGKASEEVKSTTVTRPAKSPFEYVIKQADADNNEALKSLVGKNIKDVLKELTGKLPDDSITSQNILDFLKGLPNSSKIKVGDLPDQADYIPPMKLDEQKTKLMKALSDDVLGYKVLSSLGIVNRGTGYNAYLPSQIQEAINRGVINQGGNYDYNTQYIETLLERPQFTKFIESVDSYGDEPIHKQIQAQIKDLGNQKNSVKKKAGLNSIIHEFTEMLTLAQQEYLLSSFDLGEVSITESVKPLTENLEQNTKKIRIGFKDVVLGAFTDFFTDIGGVINAVTDKITSIPTIRNYFDDQENAARSALDNKRMAQIADIQKTQKLSDLEMLQGSAYVSSNVDDFLKDLLNPMTRGSSQQRNVSFGSKNLQNLINIIGQKTAQEADKELQKESEAYGRLKKHIEKSRTYQAVGVTTVEQWIKLMQSQDMNDKKFTNYAKTELKKYNIGSTEEQRGAIASAFQEVMFKRKIVGKDDKGVDIYGEFLHSPQFIYTALEALKNSPTTSKAEKEKYALAAQAIIDYEQAAKKAGEEGISSIFDVITKFRYGNTLGESLENAMNDAGIAKNIGRVYDEIEKKYAGTINDFKSVAAQSINKAEKINTEFIDILSTELKTIIRERFKGSDSQMVEYLMQLLFKEGATVAYRSQSEIFNKLVKDRLIPELQDKDAIEKTFGLKMNDLRGANFGNEKEKILLDYVVKGQLNAPEVRDALRKNIITNADIMSVFGSIAEKGNVNPFQLLDPSLSNKQLRQARTKRKSMYRQMNSPDTESYNKDFKSLFSNMTKQERRSLLDARLDKLPEEKVQQLGKIFSSKFGTAANYADIMLDVLSPQKMLEEEGFFNKMRNLYSEIRQSKVTTGELFQGIFSGLLELPKELFKNNIGGLLQVSTYRAELAKIQNEIVFAEQKQAREEGDQIKAQQEARKRGLQALLAQNGLNKEEVYKNLGDLAPILDQFLETGKFYQDVPKEQKNKIARILKVKDVKGIGDLRKQLEAFVYESFEKDAQGRTRYDDKGKAISKKQTFNLIDPFIRMIQEGTPRVSGITEEHKNAILQIFSKMGVQNEAQMSQILKELKKDGTGMTEGLLDFLRTGNFTSELLSNDKDLFVDVLGVNNFKELENIADRRLDFFQKIQYQIVNYVNGVIDGVKALDANILNALERLKEIPIVGDFLYRVAVPAYQKISGFVQGVAGFLGGIPEFIDKTVQAMPGLRVFNAAKEDYKERSSTSLPSLIQEAGYSDLDEFRNEFYGRLEEKGIKDEKEQRKALMAFLQPNEKGTYNTIMSDKDGLAKNSKAIIESFAASIEKPFNIAERMLKNNTFTTAAVAPLHIFYLKVLPKSLLDVLMETTKFLAVLAPLVIAKGIGFALKKVGFADWFMGYWKKFRRKTGIEYIFDNIGNRIKASMNRLNANIVGGIADKINDIRLAGYFPMLLGAVEKFFGKISDEFNTKAEQLDAEFARKGKFNTQGLIGVLQRIFELTINNFRKVEKETEAQQQSWISRVMSSVASFGRGLWEMIKGIGRKFNRSRENIRTDISQGESRFGVLKTRIKENREERAKLRLQRDTIENTPNDLSDYDKYIQLQSIKKQVEKLDKQKQNLFNQIRAISKNNRNLKKELWGAISYRMPSTPISALNSTSISALEKQLKAATKKNDIAKIDEINSRIAVLKREAEILRQERLSLRREKWKSFFQIFKNWAGSLSSWATTTAEKLGDVTKGIRVRERRASVYRVKDEILAERIKQTQSTSLTGINVPSVGDAPKAFVYGEGVNEYAPQELEKMKNWYEDGKGAEIFVIPFQNKIKQGIAAVIGNVAKWISLGDFDERLAHFFTSPIESIVAMWGSAGRIIKKSWEVVVSFFGGGVTKMWAIAKRAGIAIKDALNHNAADATRFAWERTVGYFSSNVPRMVEVAKAVGKRIVGFLNHSAADTVGESWERNEQVVSNEMHQMGETAAAVGSQIAGSMEQSAKRSVSAFGRLQNMIHSIGKAGFAVGGAITAAGFAAQTIAFSLGNLGFVSEQESQALYKMTELFTIFGAVTGIISPLIGALFSSLGAIGSVSGVVISGIAGIGGAIFTFLISPVGLAVAGITTGIFMLNTLIKNMFGVDLLQGLVSFLMDGISSAFDFIVGNIPSLASGVGSAIAPLGEKIKPVIASIWQGIQDIVLAPFAPVMERLQPVIDGVKGAFKGAIDWIAGAWDEFVYKFGGRLMPIIQPALAVAQGLINALNHNPTEKIPEAWESAVTTMKGYLNNFLKFSIGIAAALTSAFAVQKIFGMMQARGMTTAVGRTQKIGGKIKEFALYANMFNDIAELTGIDLPDFVDPLVKATTFIGVLGDTAEKILPVVGAAFVSLGSAITGAFSAAAAAVGGVFPLIGIASVLIGALTLAWNTNLFDIQGKAKIVADSIYQAFKNSVVQIIFAWQGFVNKFGGKLAAIVKPALDVAQRLINALNHNPTVKIPESWRGAVEDIKGSLNTLPETGKVVGNQLNDFLSSAINKAAEKLEFIKNLFSAKSTKPGDTGFVGPVMPPSNNIVSAQGLRKPSQPGDVDFVGPVMQPQPEKPTGFWGGIAGLFGGGSTTPKIEPALLDFTKQLKMAVIIAKANSDTAAISDLEAMQMSSRAKGGMTANEYAKAILTPDYSAGQYLKSAQVLTNSGIEGYSAPEPGSKDFVGGPVIPQPEKKLGFWGSVAQMFGGEKQKEAKAEDEIAPVLLDFTKQLDIATKLANYGKETEAVTNLKALQAVSGGQLTANDYAKVIMTPDSSMGRYLKTGQSMVSAVNNPTTIGDFAKQAGRGLKIFSNQLSTQAGSELENLRLEFGDRWRYLQENGFINTDEIVTGLGDVKNSFTTLASDAWSSINRLDLPGLQGAFSRFGDDISGAFTRITNGFALVGEIFEPGAEQMSVGLSQLGDSFVTFAGEAWTSLTKLDFNGLKKASTDFGISAWEAIKQIREGFGSMTLSAIAFGLFSFISMSPLLVIMGGIGLAALGITTNFLGIGDIIFGVTRTFAALFRIISAITVAIRGIYQGVKLIGLGVFLRDIELIKAGIDRIKAFAIRGIKDVGLNFLSIGSAVGQAIQGLLKMISGLLGLMSKTGVIVFTPILGSLNLLISGSRILAKTFLGSAKSVKQSWGGVFSELKISGAGVKNTFSLVAQSITSAVLNPKQAWQGFLDLLTRIRNQAVQVMKAIGTSVVNRASALVGRNPQVAAIQTGGSTLKSAGNRAVSKNRFGSIYRQPGLTGNTGESGGVVSGIAPVLVPALSQKPAGKTGGSTLKAAGNKVVRRNRFGSGVESQPALTPGLTDNISQLGFALSGIAPAIAQPLILITSLTQSLSILGTTLFGLFPTLKTFITSTYAAGGATGVLSASFTWLSAKATLAWAAITAKTTSLWAYVTSTYAAGGATGVLSGAIAWATGWGSSFLASIVGAATSLWAYVASAFAAGGATGVLSGAIAWATGWGSSFLASIVGAATSLWAYVTSTYAASGATGVLSGAIAWATGWGSSFLASIVGAATSLWAYVTSTYAAGGATGVLSGAIAWATGWGSSFLASIVGAATSLWAYVASAFAAGGATGVVSAAFGVLAGAATTMWTAILAPILPFILGAAAIVGAVAAIYAIFKTFSGVSAFFGTFFDTFFGGLGEIFSGVVDSVKAAFSEIMSTIEMVGSLIMKPLQPLIELFGGGSGSSGIFSGAGWLLAQALLLPFRILGVLITSVVKGISLFIQGIVILGGLIASVVLAPFYIISGLVKGIQSMLFGIGSIFTSVFTAIGDGMRSVVDFMRDVPLIGQLIEWVSPKKEDTPKYATGGLISGQGTSTGDKILISASRGEYIVNAAATRQNYGLLEAINNGKELPSVTALPTPAPRMVQPPNQDYSYTSGDVAAMPPMEFNFTFGDIIVQGNNSAEMANDFLDSLEPKLEQKIRELMRKMLDFMK